LLDVRYLAKLFSWLFPVIFVSSCIHSFTDLPIHSLTHSLTHSLISSFTHQYTQSFDFWFIYSPTSPLTYLVTYSLPHSLIHSLTHSSIQLFTRLSTYSPKHPLIQLRSHSLTHSFTHSCIQWFTHAFTLTYSPWFAQQRKYYFPGHFQDIYRIKLPFLGQIIQYLKVINEDMCEKAYFYLIYNQLLIFEFKIF
jgi:hypothetical protein